MYIQQEQCDMYQKCLEEVASKANRCVSAVRRELESYRNQLTECSRHFFERQLWELQLKARLIF